MVRVGGRCPNRGTSFTPTTASGRQVLCQQSGTARGMNSILTNGRLYTGGWNGTIVHDGTWLSSTNTITGDWNHVTVKYDSVASEIKLHPNGATALTGSALAQGSHHR